MLSKYKKINNKIWIDIIIKNLIFVFFFNYYYLLFINMIYLKYLLN